MTTETNVEVYNGRFPILNMEQKQPLLYHNAKTLKGIKYATWSMLNKRKPIPMVVNITLDACQHNAPQSFP